MSQLARLKWHCRRGMRELDLILEDFLEEHYETLSDNERETFEQLLDSPNESLMAWLMEGGTPKEQPIAEMVQRILDSKKRYR